MSADTDLYQEVVIEHKRSPRNFGTLPAPTHQARGHNPSCGDNLSVQLEVDGDTIREVRFQGSGCAISMASASMMTEAIRGKDVDTARELQRHFRAVLTGAEDPEGAPIGKLVSLAAVRRYPSRIKCGLLGWHALMHALDGDAAPVEEGVLTDKDPS